MRDPTADSYIDALVKANPGIREIWLFGSRAAGSARPDSDWDFLVFADESTFSRLAAASTFNHPEIDLLVVYDGNSFCKPWWDGHRLKRGTLSKWCWTPISDTEATYRATKEKGGDEFGVDVSIARAVRIWP